jgi:Lrp/AsnC family leucine-responsive transcriptional regulator
VRSNIAIQTLKAGAPLPLEHLEVEPKDLPRAAKRSGPNKARRGAVS